MLADRRLILFRMSSISYLGVPNASSLLRWESFVQICGHSGYAHHADGQSIAADLVIQRLSGNVLHTDDVVVKDTTHKSESGQGAALARFAKSPSLPSIFARISGLKNGVSARRQSGSPIAILANS